jgi:hypothetical protein
MHEPEQVEVTPIQKSIAEPDDLCLSGCPHRAPCPRINDGGDIDWENFKSRGHFSFRVTPHHYRKIAKPLDLTWLGEIIGFRFVYDWSKETILGLIRPGQAQRAKDESNNQGPDHFFAW